MKPLKLIHFVGLVGIFFVLTFGLQQAAFHGPTYYDSAERLERNQHVFLTQGIKGVIGIFPQRPLVMASFYLNYQVCGFSMYCFRVVNALIMGLTGAVVVLCVSLLLQTPELQHILTRSQSNVIAILIGCAFVAHPIQIFVVTYVWQRMALLASLFQATALTSYVATRLGRISRPLGYTLCCIAFVLGMVCKETTIVTPVLIFLAEVAFFDPDMRQITKLLATSAVIVCIVLMVMSVLERPHGAGHSNTGIITTLRTYYEEGGLTLQEMIVNQSRALFRYIALVLVPLPSHVQLIAPQPVVRSVATQPLALVYVTTSIILAAFGVMLLRTKPLIGFGILFFFCTLIPDCFLVPQYQFVPYRVSFPMLGIFLVFAGGFLYLIQHMGAHSKRLWLQKGLAGVACASIACFALVTVSKAHTWNDPVEFWSDIVRNIAGEKNIEKYPSAQSLTNLGIALRDRDRYPEAISCFERALKIRPDAPLTQANLAFAYARTGKLEVADDHFKKAVNQFPDSSVIRRTYGSFLLSQNRLDEAFTQLRHAVRLRPDNPDNQLWLARAYFVKGDYPQALVHFRKVTDIHPRHAEAHFLLGKSLQKMGKDGEAFQAFMQTLKIQPDHSQAHNDVGIALAVSGKMDQAIFHFQQGLKNNPSDKTIRANLENAIRESAASPK
jgi:protein O-mannosyl-transferase